MGNNEEGGYIVPEPDASIIRDAIETERSIAFTIKIPYPRRKSALRDIWFWIKFLIQLPFDKYYYKEGKRGVAKVAFIRLKYQFRILIWGYKHGQ